MNRVCSQPSILDPFACALVSFALLFGAGCVPRERPEGSPSGSAAPLGSSKKQQPPPVLPTSNAADAVAQLPSAAQATPDPLLDAVFSDDFERAELGPNWRATSPVWQVTGGRLCGENARNHPVWLARRLPKNARVEFQALSHSPEGDIKAEFWGDGQSAATAVSYTDATSYLTIFGGWKNTYHVLARIDEHARSRQEIKLGPAGADVTHSAIIPDRLYQFQVERRDGRTVRWLVDGMDLLKYADDDPLLGPGHEHLGFNDWQVRVCFDNLRVAPLPD
jgi:hypothetical protein